LTSAPHTASTVTKRKVGCVHAPKNTVASPTKFRKPGSPQPAIAAITNTTPMKRSRFDNPPSWLISSVPVWL